MRHPIDSKDSYHEMMVAVYNLISKGEANLTTPELNKLSAMAADAEKYEDEVLRLKPAPKNGTCRNCGIDNV